MVTVISGANANTLNLAGKTVGEVRAQFASALNIPEGATATLDGDEVGDSHVLYEGDTVRFSKATAEKG